MNRDLKFVFSYFRLIRRWPDKKLIWLVIFLFQMSASYAFEAAPPHMDFSGYFKSLNFFTRTSGYNPDMVDQPLFISEAEEDVFNTTEKFRLQVRGSMQMSEKSKAFVKIDYDHQAHFGSFVNTGDFRLAQELQEERQFVDLGQTLVESEDAFYEHRLYRASVGYSNDFLTAEVGRQQIEWGVGHFFTPTDLFNPFDPLQIELDERQGVDAVNVKSQWGDYQLETIYTPGGKRLHPQRYLARLSRDIAEYEVGVLGGRVRRDHAAGFDWQGNIQDVAVRGEFLYREAELEKDFVQFTLNADYNFPGNIYGLVEYHYNGQGRRDPSDYQRDRFIRGELYHLGRNYLGTVLGHDFHPLLRLENRTIWNMDDASVFVRPEIQYEVQADLHLNLGTQLFLGHTGDEYGTPYNLYFGEVKYSF